MIYVCFVVSECSLHVLPNTRFHVVLRFVFPRYTSEIFVQSVYEAQ